MKKVLLILLVIFATVFAMDADAQCAMCKAVAETGSHGEDQSSIGEQLNIGILFLMAIPYIFILIIPLIVFRKKIKEVIREFRGVYK